MGRSLGDIVSWSLSIGAWIFIVNEVTHFGIGKSVDLVFQNPLLGGDEPTQPLPVWTYYFGHIVPGVILQTIGALTATFITREWRFAPREDFRALIITILALSGSAPALAPVHKVLYEKSVGYLYFDFWEHSMLWVASSVVIGVLITETWFYWIHRALHCGWLYKYIHGVHHSFTPSTSSCASAFHPLDIVILTFGAQLIPMLIPIHSQVLSAILLTNLVFTVIQHTATRASFGFGIFSDGNLHNIHHDYHMVPKNCGSLLCVWDRLCGTYENKIPPWAQKKNQQIDSKKR